MTYTLDPFAHRYVTGRVRTGELATISAAGYRSTLGAFSRAHGRRRVGQVGQATVERWLETRLPMKPSTKATQWSQVSMFLDWLVRQGKLRANPCQDMQAPRRPRTEPRTLGPEDIVALLDVAPDTRARAIIHLEVGMAARRVEVHRARVEDWSRREGTMLLVGKGGHERIVPVPTGAARAFDAYLREHPAATGPFFRSYQRPHMPLSTSALGHYMVAWMYEAGVKHGPHDGVSGHALRRTCASDVLDGCNDLRVVQELLGHAHLSSSAPYLRRAQRAAIREALEGRAYWGHPGAEGQAA